MTDPPSPERTVALVTGASRGLGAVLAELLGRNGFEVVVNARGREELERLAARLAGGGLTVHIVPGDVSDPGTRRALVEVVERIGRLDVLVNNASELGPSPLLPLAQLRAEDLERVFRVNVISPLLLVQQFLPVLERSHGRVVNISSDAAVAGYPGWGGYGASKAALDLLTLTLAHEMKDAGVSAVSVDPGDMRTAMHQAAFPGEDISDRPLPEVTVPFWVWLLNQDPTKVSGARFKAQADRWEIPT